MKIIKKNMLLNIKLIIFLLNIKKMLKIVKKKK